MISAIATTLGWLSFISTLCCLFIFPIMAFIRSTRRLAGGGYVIASYVFGLCLWIMCFLTVLDEWGLAAALVGALIAGVGVLPMAVVALAWASKWALAAEILVVGGIAIGVRLLGVWLLNKAQSEKSD